MGRIILIDVNLNFRIPWNILQSVLLVTKVASCIIPNVSLMKMMAQFFHLLQRISKNH